MDTVCLINYLCHKSRFFAQLFSSDKSTTARSNSLPSAIMHNNLGVSLMKKPPMASVLGLGRFHGGLQPTIIQFAKNREINNNLAELNRTVRIYEIQ